MESFELNTIEEAVEDLRQGKVIIVVDDADRENEGDFVACAHTITPDVINFMATHGRGLICTPLSEERADELELFPMVTSNTSMHETAFTVSIDLLGNGCTTGISAYDRSTGIRALVDPATKPSDFAKPGHIFPLRAKSGGVLRRSGHTEATVDLARLAGFSPAGVLVEILNEDGSMARLPQLKVIAEKHDLKIISIKDLVAYRLKHEILVQEIMTKEISTSFGPFKMVVFEQKGTEDHHVALVRGDWTEDEEIVVRVHSSASHSEVFGLLNQSYFNKLSESLKVISEHNKGVLLFMRHEENKKPLLEELASMVEHNEDYATQQSNSVEQRDFGIGAQILSQLGVRKMRLLSSHPRKRIGLDVYGLEVVETIPLS